VAHEVRGVGAHDAEPAVVRRHEELVAQRDDVRVDLGDLDARKWQVAMAELGERSATQAEHRDASRLGLEEQEAHHRAGVFEVQRVRVRESHPALDLADREVQRLRAQAFVNVGPDMLRAVRAFGRGRLGQSRHRVQSGGARMILR
jgi:hypothetical protein